MRWTEEDLAALQKRRQQGQQADWTTQTPKAKNRAKYGNKAVLVDLGPSGEIVNGHLRFVHYFQSQHEADYFAELKLRRHAKEIANIRLQEPFALIVRQPDGRPQSVGEWLADFVFMDAASGLRHVVDAKGFKTHLYELKKKIVEACWGITIEEV
jgi:hypothetical protein